MTDDKSQTDCDIKPVALDEDAARVRRKDPDAPPADTADIHQATLNRRRPITKRGLPPEERSEILEQQYIVVR